MHAVSTDAKPATNDRRANRRIKAPAPVRLRAHTGNDQSARIRDVSSSGVFLYTQAKIEQGTDVELVLILPEELTLGAKCWVCCQATVVRVEESGHEFGVAARIRRMDMLPEMEM